MELKVLVNSMGAALLTVLTFLFGGWDNVLGILVTLITIDYISGLACGAIDKNLSSAIGWRGLFRKGAVLLVVIIAHKIDIISNNADPIFRSAAAYFYIANEGISITENFDRLGVPLPGFITKFLKQVKNTNGEGLFDEK